MKAVIGDVRISQASLERLVQLESSVVVEVID